ncbi:hypothetical protein ABZX40_39890 [Streptomyces sp. NPDC004610]|uniref:hypothetical protein n=1 Tax=unclassified Streptomyces TaxID=2593676 RepID=UPI0033B4830D
MSDHNTFAVSPEGIKRGSRPTDQVANLCDRILTSYDRYPQYPSKATFDDHRDPTVRAVLEKVIPIQEGISDALHDSVGAIAKSGNMINTSADDFQSQQDQNLSDINRSGRH